MFGVFAEKSARCFLLLAALLVAAPAGAEPMDLSDSTARWVSVRFEVSPPDHPGQIRSRFSRRFLARLEPGAHERELRVTVAAPVVEKQKPSIVGPTRGS